MASSKTELAKDERQTNLKEMILHLWESSRYTTTGKNSQEWSLTLFWWTYMSATQKDSERCLGIMWEFPGPQNSPTSHNNLSWDKSVHTKSLHQQGCQTFVALVCLRAIGCYSELCHHSGWKAPLEVSSPTPVHSRLLKAVSSQVLSISKVLPSPSGPLFQHQTTDCEFIFNLHARGISLSITCDICPCPFTVTLWKYSIFYTSGIGIKASSSNKSSSLIWTLKTH